MSVNTETKQRFCVSFIDVIAQSLLEDGSRRAGRAAEACAILAPALDGFSPTAEMPEINDAQTLLEWTQGA